ncbi:unnamed protein product [Closterium sp. Naga37s-1]|nr:unnamed protein product [Closterium sp. Naga37s-1]
MTVHDVAMIPYGHASPPLDLRQDLAAAAITFFVLSHPACHPPDPHQDLAAAFAFIMCLLDRAIHSAVLSVTAAISHSVISSLSHSVISSTLLYTAQPFPLPSDQPFPPSPSSSPLGSHQATPSYLPHSFARPSRSPFPPTSHSLLPPSISPTSWPPSSSSSSLTHPINTAAITTFHYTSHSPIPPLPPPRHLHKAATISQQPLSASFLPLIYSINRATISPFPSSPPLHSPSPLPHTSTHLPLFPTPPLTFPSSPHLHSPSPLPHTSTHIPLFHTPPLTFPSSPHLHSPSPLPHTSTHLPLFPTPPLTFPGHTTRWPPSASSSSSTHSITMPFHTPFLPSPGPYGPHVPCQDDKLCADFLSLAPCLKCIVFLSPPPFYHVSGLPHDLMHLSFAFG